MNLQKKNNKVTAKSSPGFTLVEMVVAFAILGVAIVAIGGLMVSGVRQYSRVHAESTVQNEAQMALSQIQEVVIDASLGVSYNVRTSEDGTLDHFVKSDSEASLSGQTVTDKYLYVFNWDSNRSQISTLIIHYSVADKKLYYAEKILSGYSAASTDTIAAAVNVDGITNWELLAENVENFSMDLTDTETSNKVTAAISILRDGKTYDTSLVITLRNSVLVNPENIAKIYERAAHLIITKITGVELTTSSSSIVKGGTLQLKTRVLGTGYPSQSIYQWKIEAVSGVTTSKDESGKINISSGTESLYTLYDSLDSSANTGEASIETGTKVLNLSDTASRELLKITATVYAGKDDTGADVYLSDFKYVAVKEISTFTVQPNPDMKLDANKTLQIPANGWDTASTADNKGTGLPTESGNVNTPSMDVYPGNIIDMKSDVTGANLDADDQKVTWSIYSIDEGTSVTVSANGTVTIGRYSQQGIVILKAYPDLNPNMCLYYIIRIGNQYGSSNNALEITGLSTVNREDTLQLGLTLNGFEMDADELSDFNWSCEVGTNGIGNITNSPVTISNSGLLSVSRDLSFDYAFTIVVKASMKSNPQVMAAKVITVPRVSLKMTEDTIISKRDTTIKANTIRCIVTGLKNYDLTWSMCSQTNPSYYNTSLTNGSHITGKGTPADTCEIYISGQEPQSLTYMRARATLKDYSNYYAETYISLKEVNFSISSNKSKVSRGDSAVFTASLTPADSGISTSGTQWSIVSAKNSSGKAVTTEGITLSAAAGASTTVTVGSNYYPSTSTITVTVKGTLGGLSQEKTFTIPGIDGFYINGGKTVKRGGSVDLSVNTTMGGTVEWKVSSVSTGSDDLNKVSVTDKGNGSCSLNVDPAFNPGNASNASITVEATVAGTDLTATATVTVEQVKVTVKATRDGSNKNRYDCSMTVTGFASVADYTTVWGLSSDGKIPGGNYITAGNSGNEVALSNVKLAVDGKYDVQVVNNNSSLKQIYVYGGVKAGDAVVAYDIPAVTFVKLKSYTELKNWFDNHNYRYFGYYTNQGQSGGPGAPPGKDQYCVWGSAFTDYTNGNIQYYKVYVYKYDNYYHQYIMISDAYYLAYDNGSWYYIYQGNSSKEWTQITSDSTCESIFGFKDPNGKTALGVCSALQNAY